MVGASKILTVSYGTFSCTLEGFEDPFSTMKAIAEYFRDLAADDRYFGAEPPQPDAQMLHRIAEREVQRRVEARVQDNGVILRAAEMPEAPAAPVPAAPPPGLTPADSALSQSVAEKLRRMRAAARGEQQVAAVPVAEPAPAPLAAAFEPEVEPVAPVEVPEPAAAVAEAPAPVAAEPEVEPAPVVEPPAAEAVAPEPEIAEPEIAEPEAVAAVAEPEPEAVEPVAEAPAPAEPQSVENALLAALAEEPAAALTAAFEQPEAAFEPAFEDEDSALIAALAELPAEDPAPTPAEDADTGLEEALLAALAEDIPAATEEPEPQPAAQDDDALLAALAEVQTAVEEEPAAEDGIDAALFAAMAEDEPVEYAADPETAFEAQEAPAVPAEEAPAEEAQADDEPQAEEEAQAEEPLSPEEAAERAAAELAAAEAPQPPAEESPAAQSIQRARARVIRIRRVEAAAAPLAEEAEAELQRELTTLRGPADPATAPLPETTTLPEAARLAAETQPEPQSEPHSETERREARPALPAAAEDASVRRLLDATNSQMEEPESRRRLSAIAHLKAAVAATFADRRAGGAEPDAPAQEERRIDPYRSDLEQVMRPRRPTGTGAATTPRPAEPAARPAPLVLVSAQRIDAPRSAAPAVPAQPVRPRRVQAVAVAAVAAIEITEAYEDEDDHEEAGEDLGSTNIFDDGSGFAAFAERLGARELQDLLEAAAVYAACVEGRPSVTRPQIMRHVSTALPEDAEPSREDVLRSFGRLLRDGRIEKVKRGQFAVPEGSHVLEEGRRLAG